MDNSKGVIFFSLGSVMRGHTMKQSRREEITNVFASLAETILWKWESDLLDKPANVHTSKWFPQRDILGAAFTKFLPKCWWGSNTKWWQIFWIPTNTLSFHSSSKNGSVYWSLRHAGSTGGSDRGGAHGLHTFLCRPVPECKKRNPIWHGTICWLDEYGRGLLPEGNCSSAPRASVSIQQKQSIGRGRRNSHAAFPWDLNFIRSSEFSLIAAVHDDPIRHQGKTPDAGRKWWDCRPHSNWKVPGESDDAWSSPTNSDIHS